jgi:pimeloyl-ACP methyl ester carboxylesterase
MQFHSLVIASLLVTHVVGAQPHGFVTGRSRLYYESVGKGTETIVVVHGGPGISHDYLRPEWDMLARSGRVVYYDQNGCGKSGRVPPYGWRSHVQDLDRLLAVVAPHQKVVLAGSSWGSMLAIYYTYLDPDRVRALILSGVPLGLVGIAPKPSAPWLEQQSGARLDSVNRGLPASKGQSRQPLPSPLAKRIKEDCPDVAAIINMSLGDAPHGVALQRIKVATLIVHGAERNQMPGDGGPGLAAILPNAKLVTIPKASHDPWLDQPTSFFAAANGFLRQTR